MGVSIRAHEKKLRNWRKYVYATSIFIAKRKIHDGTRRPSPNRDETYTRIKGTVTARPE